MIKTNKKKEKANQNSFSFMNIAFTLKMIENFGTSNYHQLYISVRFSTCFFI